jgi:hypothetical protein
MDAPAKPAFCGATRSKRKGFGSEGVFCSGGFAVAAEEIHMDVNFWTKIANLS